MNVGKAERGLMFRSAAAFIFAGLIAAPGFALAADAQRLPPGPQPTLYFPERNDWQHKKPEEVGMDSARLDQAVKSAIANENPLTKENDIVAVVRWINPGPSLNDVVGKMLASIKTPAQKDALAK